MFGNHCMKMKYKSPQREKKYLLRLSDRSGRIEDRPFCKAENSRTKSLLDQKSLCSANLSKDV